MTDPRTHPDGGPAEDKAAAGLRTGFLAALSGRLAASLNAVGTVWIFALMVLINADIGGRWLFNAPVRGVPEIVSLSIVGIVFLQMSHSLGAGRIIRSDVLITAVTRRIPALGHGLNALFHLVGTALFGVLLWASWPYLAKAWTENLFIGSEGDFTVPIWPIKLIILIGCTAMALQFLTRALGHTRAALQSGAGDAQ